MPAAAAFSQAKNIHAPLEHIALKGPLAVQHALQAHTNNTLTKLRAASAPQENIIQYTGHFLPMHVSMHLLETMRARRQGRAPTQHVSQDIFRISLARLVANHVAGEPSVSAGKHLAQYAPLAHIKM